MLHETIRRLQIMKLAIFSPPTCHYQYEIGRQALTYGGWMIPCHSLTINRLGDSKDLLEKSYSCSIYRLILQKLTGTPLIGISLSRDEKPPVQWSHHDSVQGHMEEMCSKVGPTGGGAWTTPGTSAISNKVLIAFRRLGIGLSG